MRISSKSKNEAWTLFELLPSSFDLLAASALS
jgi:hypothetical protein